MRSCSSFVVAALCGGLAGGCSASPAPAPEPKINPHSVPSLALLSGSNTRGEDVSGSGAGKSCEEVSNDARQRAREAGGGGEEAPEEHNEEIRKVLDRGAYLNACNVPATSAIELCVAVVDGEAKGVTVWLKPGTDEQTSCIAGQIRQLSFPAHELVSVARTNFAAQ